MSGDVCEYAWETWYRNTVLGTDTEDVSHEAFCAGWDACIVAAPIPDKPVTDVQAVPPAALAAIAGMVATRYSGVPTQRDLDVANFAAAAEWEACALIAEQHRAIYYTKAGGYQPLADLIRARTTP